MTIEYHEAKNQKNIKKHHISILELATIFSNPFIKPSIDIFDRVVKDKRDNIEIRYHAYGWTTTGWYVKI